MFPTCPFLRTRLYLFYFPDDDSRYKKFQVTTTARSHTTCVSFEVSACCDILVIKRCSLSRMKKLRKGGNTRMTRNLLLHRCQYPSCNMVHAKVFTSRQVRDEMLQSPCMDDKTSSLVGISQVMPRCSHRINLMRLCDNRQRYLCDTDDYPHYFNPNCHRIKRRRYTSQDYI